MEQQICISTGIYPPDIGGPALYAQQLKQVWEQDGHTVHLCIFSVFNWLPTGLRHIVYFFSICITIFRSDVVYILDTFSAAFPTVIACKIFGKRMILRTGGDFLWEAYLNRVKKPILLKDFYNEVVSFNRKERIIFSIIGFILRSVDTIIWSTEWQKNIFMTPYDLSRQRHVVIENYYGERLSYREPINRLFIAASRNSLWKNIDILVNIFQDPRVISAGILLDINQVPHNIFLAHVQESYAVITASLSDISPNTILDAIRCGTPFIMTQETGLYERIKDIALFVDPLNSEDIKEKVLFLADEENYKRQQKKVREFTFTHTWKEIASEYLSVYTSLQ